MLLRVINCGARRERAGLLRFPRAETCGKVNTRGNPQEIKASLARCVCARPSWCQFSVISTLCNFPRGRDLKQSWVLGVSAFSQIWMTFLHLLNLNFFFLFKIILMPKWHTLLWSSRFWSPSIIMTYKQDRALKPFGFKCLSKLTLPYPRSPPKRILAKIIFLLLLF